MTQEERVKEFQHRVRELEAQLVLGRGRLVDAKADRYLRRVGGAVRRVGGVGLGLQGRRRLGRDRFVRVDGNNYPIHAGCLGAVGRRISSDDRYGRFSDEGCRPPCGVFLSAEAGPAKSRAFCGANEPGFNDMAAVPTLMATLSGTGRPATSSSRNRLTTNSE